MSVMESNGVTVSAREPERKDLQSIGAVRGKLTPEQALASLQEGKQGSKAVNWTNFLPVLVDDASKHACDRKRHCIVVVCTVAAKQWLWSWLHV
jgi:hypothetical protein